MFFLQTPEWEGFAKALGRTTYRVADMLAIESTTPLGSYWYVGRPQPQDVNAYAELFELAKQSGAVFVRIDPKWEIDLSTLEPGYSIRPTTPTQPQTSLMRYIDRDEDELLKTMHSKWRYNIRLAKKKGVKVEESADPNHHAFKAFLEFSKRTSARQDFRYHPPSYYRTLLQVLGKNTINRTSVVVALQDDLPLTANIVLWAEDTAYYLHGASDHTHRKLMGPHLLQFETMRKAKEAGLKWYDFWGIAPVSNPEKLESTKSSASKTMWAKDYTYDESHPWAGVTKFKLGFDGQVIHWPDSFDVVLNPTRYSLYTMGRRIRRMGR